MITNTQAERLRALTAADFDPAAPEPNGWTVVNAVCAELRHAESVLDCAQDMFDLMERLDDVELGSPGPLVHTLESTAPAYEPWLEASMRRQPTTLSVWMVNRLLNLPRDDRTHWLELLSLAAAHPFASDGVRADAADFLAFQAQR